MTPRRKSRSPDRYEEAIRALARLGNAERAAAELGIHVSTLHKWVNAYCIKNGYDSAVHAAYWLDRATINEATTRQGT